ncbi:hypothetical protein GCM10009633_09620 [Janibacter melonis]
MSAKVVTIRSPRVSSSQSPPIAQYRLKNACTVPASAASTSHPRARPVTGPTLPDVGGRREAKGGPAGAGTLRAVRARS